MNTVEQSMNREDVLGTLRQTYAGFGKLLEHFDKAQMKALLVHGNWAVKHILAHLASWEKLEIGWMEEVTAGRRPLLYTEGYEWDMIDREQQNELIHGYNARVLEECQERSLQDVLGELGDTQERMLDVVSRLPKAAFSDPNILFWVKLEVPRDPWTPLPVNSHEHYRDHANWLRAWAEKKG